MTTKTRLALCALAQIWASEAKRLGELSKEFPKDSSIALQVIAQSTILDYCAIKLLETIREQEEPC